MTSLLPVAIFTMPWPVPAGTMPMRIRGLGQTRSTSFMFTPVELASLSNNPVTASVSEPSPPTITILSKKHNRKGLFYIFISRQRLILAALSTWQNTIRILAHQKAINRCSVYSSWYVQHILWLKQNYMQLYVISSALSSLRLKFTLTWKNYIPTVSLVMLANSKRGTTVFLCNLTPLLAVPLTGFTNIRRFWGLCFTEINETKCIVEIHRKPTKNFYHKNMCAHDTSNIFMRVCNFYIGLAFDLWPGNILDN